MGVKQIHIEVWDPWKLRFKHILEGIHCSSYANSRRFACCWPAAVASPSRRHSDPVKSSPCGDWPSSGTLHSWSLPLARCLHNMETIFANSNSIKIHQPDQCMDSGLPNITSILSSYKLNSVLQLLISCWKGSHAHLGFIKGAHIRRRFTSTG